MQRYKGRCLTLLWILPVTYLLGGEVSVSPRAGIVGRATPVMFHAELAAAQTEIIQGRAEEDRRHRALDPLSATYRIQDQDITLSHGRSEIVLSPDSATTIETAVWGNSVRGDLDGDGDEDAALFLVHDPGGSGVFYYVAVALNENGRYRGTNAVLLGDRIVPRDLTIHGSAIKATYFNRAADASMSSRPSVETESYLVLDGGVLKVAAARHDLILVDSPQPGDTVASPLIVKGRARGTWFFEGDFPMRLEDRSGNTLARGYATAKGPWMTQDFVPFEGTIEFTKPLSEDSAILILEKDNPSDRRELDDAIRFTVLLE